MKILLLYLLSFLTIILASLQQLKNASNFFTLQLLQEHKQNPDNIVLSPIAISIGLGAVLYGARGAARREIQTKLNFTTCLEVLKSEFDAIIPEIMGNDTILANRIYVNSDRHIKIHKYYRSIIAKVFKIDFVDNFFYPESEAAFIFNEYIRSKFYEEVVDLIDASDFRSRDLGILITALYFRSNWTRRFPSKAIKNDSFYTVSDKAIQSEFIELYADCMISTFDDLSGVMLEIDLEGGAIFNIFLPHKENRLEKVLEKAADKIFYRRKLNKHLTQIVLPKLQIESQINVKRIFIEKLGWKDLFNEPDLDVIADHFNLGAIMHKSVLTLNENGINVEPSLNELEAKPLKPDYSFIANRPFLYFIKKNDVIILAGLVQDPTIVPQDLFL